MDDLQRNRYILRGNALNERDSGNLPKEGRKTPYYFWVISINSICYEEYD
ncbi:hypothetical protein [Bacillus niameyensis]|nr:hypothetical protein [Bacillus niameyensis]